MIGKTLSHYRVLEEIGRGGIGVVYRAYDVSLDREVALKILGPSVARDPEQERRALNAHARHERMRAQLTGDQSDEIRAFFAEEDERGELALG